MTWVILTFLSSFARAIYGVCTKIFSNRLNLSIYTQSVLITLAGSLLTILLSPLIGGISFDVHLINQTSLALMVISQGAGSILYFAAIKHLSNSLAQIAFSSILIFNTILSVIFFNLSLSGTNLAGVGFLLIAIFLAVFDKSKLNFRGIWLMTLAAFCFAVFQLSSTTLASQMGLSAYLICTYLGAAILIFAAKPKVVISDISKNLSKSLFIIPATTVFPSIIQIITIYFAYRLAPEPTKVTLIAPSQIIFAVLLSYIFLKEHTHLTRKLIAAVLVLISAYLIKS